MNKAPTNGWRSGQDPVQRRLRIVVSLVLLAVFVYVAVSPDTNIDDAPTITLALGALMMLLGYETLIKLPFTVAPTDKQRKVDDGDNS